METGCCAGQGCLDLAIAAKELEPGCARSSVVLEADR